MNMLRSAWFLLGVMVLVSEIIGAGTTVKAQSVDDEILLISLIDGIPTFVAQTSDGAHTRELAQVVFEDGADVTSASLSPDGNSIAVTSRKDRGEGSPIETIFVLDVQSGIATEVTRDKRNSAFPVWSPDSTRLAFLHGFGINGYRELNIIDLATLEITVVVDDNSLAPVVQDELGMSIRGLAWSSFDDTLVIAGITSLPEAYNLMIKVSIDPLLAKVVSLPDIGVSSTISWSNNEPEVVYVGCGLDYVDDLCYINIETEELLFLTDMASTILDAPNPSITEMIVASNDNIVFRYGFDSSWFSYNVVSRSLSNVSINQENVLILGFIPSSFTIRSVIPTPTITPLPTPTITPTPAPFSRLRLTSMCSGDPATVC